MWCPSWLRVDDSSKSKISMGVVLVIIVVLLFLSYLSYKKTTNALTIKTTAGSTAPTITGPSETVPKREPATQAQAAGANVQQRQQQQQQQQDPLKASMGFSVA